MGKCVQEMTLSTPNQTRGCTNPIGDDQQIRKSRRDGGVIEPNQSQKKWAWKGVRDRCHLDESATDKDHDGPKGN